MGYLGSFKSEDELDAERQHAARALADAQQRAKLRDVSPGFARQRAERQREADAASTPDRLLDLGRGIATLFPGERAIVDFVARPVESPADIPELRAVPSRVKSFELPVDAMLEKSTTREIFDELFEKVRAEDERCRRMLPPAPPGMAWRGELQSRSEINFATYGGDLVVRLVYRLIDTRTGEDVLERWTEAGLEQ